jgi:hypothetical protein
VKPAVKSLQKYHIIDNIKVADGLMHYKLNLGKWEKYFNVTHAVKKLFTPALNII